MYPFNHFISSAFGFILSTDFFPVNQFQTFSLVISFIVVVLSMVGIRFSY
jgi:hypothetical protein